MKSRTAVLAELAEPAGRKHELQIQELEEGTPLSPYPLLG